MIISPLVIYALKIKLPSISVLVLIVEYDVYNWMDIIIPNGSPEGVTI